MRHFPRMGKLPLPHTALEGLGDVQPCIAWRQANAIGSIDGEDHLLDQRAVGFGIIDRRAIPLTLLQLSKIGKPESACSVEDEVVGPAQTMTIAFGVNDVHFAAGEVYPLNTPAGISFRETFRRAAVRGEFEPTIVTDVDFSVGSDSCAVGTAAGFGNDLFGAIGSHAGKRAARDLHDQHTAVFHGDGTFREAESRGDFPYLWHVRYLLSLRCWHTILMLSNIEEGSAGPLPSGQCLHLKLSAINAQLSAKVLARYRLGTVIVAESVLGFARSDRVGA